ncbi:MAG: hypothetical protein P8X55_00650, partial [Desulfosarcinaceae bacterium]
MQTIILASPRVDQWRAFSDALQADLDVDVVQARSAEQAEEAARKLNPLAVAIDATLGGLPGAELVRRLVGINAMINTALASEKSEEVFHEETEGLGILMKLSSPPTAAEAGRFAALLRQVAG